MALHACPACGSLRMRMATIADGMAAEGGDTQFHVCPDCHFRGEPLRFEGETAYQEFVRALAGGEDPAGVAQEDAARRPEPEADVLDLPARRRAPGSAVFIVLVAVALFAFAALQFYALGVDGGGPDAMLVLGGIVTAAIGLAFLRIAWRMWAPPRAA